MLNGIKMRQIKVGLALFIFAILLSSGAMGLATFGGDTVSIDVPVEDDIFAAGSIVNVNAPVQSIIAAGGTVSINAPVSGDVIAAGGQVFVNSNVGGKLIAAGGNLNLKGNVTKNAVLGGGNINIQKGSLIGKDAVIYADSVYTAGTINGTLKVSATEMTNNGTAGRVEFEKVVREEKKEAHPVGFSVFQILMAIGYLIAGIILLRFFPALFAAMDQEVRSSMATKTLVGILSIVVSFVLMVILAVTFVGMPVALMLLIFVAGALMLSGLFVSFGLGRSILSRAGKQTSDMIAFVIGFVILNILFLLPYIGGIISTISAGLGMGAIIYAIFARMSR